MDAVKKKIALPPCPDCGGEKHDIVRQTDIKTSHFKLFGQTFDEVTRERKWVVRCRACSLHAREFDDLEELLEWALKKGRTIYREDV